MHKSCLPDINSYIMLTATHPILYDFIYVVFHLHSPRFYMSMHAFVLNWMDGTVIFTTLAGYMIYHYPLDMVVGFYICLACKLSFLS